MKSKQTLLFIDNQTSRVEPLEDEVQAAHQGIIEIREHCLAVSHHKVHEALESISSVLRTKHHADVLKEPKGSDDGRLGEVSGMHQNLMVALPHVYHGEEETARHLSCEVHHIWERISVRHSDTIEMAVVAAWVPGTIPSDFFTMCINGNTQELFGLCSDQTLFDHCTISRSQHLDQQKAVLCELHPDPEAPWNSFNFG